MGNTRGLVYRVFGKYSEQAFRSIVSLRASGGSCKDLPVTVYDFNREENPYVAKIAAMDNLRIVSVSCEGKYEGSVDREHRFRKFACPCYDVELRIDADTMILGDIGEIFERAEKEGFCGVLDQWKPERLSLRGEKIRQINGGVIAYTRGCARDIYDHFLALKENSDTSGSKEFALAADQPVLNTILDDLGLNRNENLLPLNYNRPSIKEGTVVFHYYSFAKQNRGLMERAAAIHLDDLDITGMAKRGDILVLVGGEGGGRPYAKTVYVTAASPFPEGEVLSLAANRLKSLDLELRDGGSFPLAIALLRSGWGKHLNAIYLKLEGASREEFEDLLTRASRDGVEIFAI